jgi:hypothetical protein
MRNDTEETKAAVSGLLSTVRERHGCESALGWTGRHVNASVVKTRTSSVATNSGRSNKTRSSTVDVFLRSRWSTMHLRSRPKSVTDRCRFGDGTIFTCPFACLFGPFVRYRLPPCKDAQASKCPPRQFSGSPHAQTAWSVRTSLDHLSRGSRVTVFLAAHRRYTLSPLAHFFFLSTRLSQRRLHFPARVRRRAVRGCRVCRRCLV